MSDSNQKKPSKIEEENASSRAHLRSIALMAEQFPETLKFRPKLMQVAIADLKVDRRYQPPLRDGKLRMIMRVGYADVGALAIVVSRREDGSLWVVDGQHRLEAARRTGHSHIPSFVIEGATISDEARLYKLYATARKAPDAIGLYHASITAKDPLALEIESVLRTYGLRVGDPGSRRSHTVITAPRSLYRIIAFGGKEHLSFVLSTSVKAWPEEPLARGAEILLGLSTFLAVMKHRINIDEFVERLSAEPIDMLMRRARMRTGDVRLSLVKSVAAECQNVWNKKRRSHTVWFDWQLQVRFDKQTGTATPVAKTDDTPTQ